MVPGLDIIGQGVNGAEALTLAHSHAPDLMVIDLAMPVMEGAQAIPLLRTAAPGMRIVVYSSDLDSADLSRASSPDAMLLKGAI